MSTPKIKHPNELSPETSERLLQSAQEACTRYNKSTSPARELHIRDVWFVIDEGNPTLDLFVEPFPGHQGTSPFPEPEQAVTLDECLPLHHFLLEDGCLDTVDDNVGVRVGSLGIDPPLRTLAQFETAVGQLISLKTWTKRNGRDRFTGTLSGIVAHSTPPTLRLTIGTEETEVPLSAVKFAQALLEKPKSAKANAPKTQKSPKRGGRKA
jgi:ribosome maturation factor RimP